MSVSETLFDRAKKCIPGGVNSPVRAFGSVGIAPRFITRGAGDRIWDEDGKEYIDYIGSWGPMILGHGHPAVLEAVEKAVRDGLSFGAATAKFKGVLRFWYPDGGEHDDSKKRRLKTALKTISDSNNLRIDFTKEWDGAQLAGAVVGMIFRDKEWDYNGKTGFTAQPYSVISLDDWQSGNYKIPDPLTLSPTAQTYTAAPAGQQLDDDLPF